MWEFEFFISHAIWCTRWLDISRKKFQRSFWNTWTTRHIICAPNNSYACMESRKGKITIFYWCIRRDMGLGIQTSYHLANDLLLWFQRLGLLCTLVDILAVRSSFPCYENCRSDQTNLVVFFLHSLQYVRSCIASIRFRRIWYCWPCWHIWSIHP